jgi:hypothetical protein
LWSNKEFNTTGISYQLLDDHLFINVLENSQLQPSTNDDDNNNDNIIIMSCDRFSFFPGTSPLEPVVNPTTQASSLSL